MRAVETEIAPSKARKKTRPEARSAPLRRTRLRSLALEPLESRTLLATLPAAVVTKTLDVSNSGGNQSSPSIAVNPTNPFQAVAVWTRLDPNLAPGPTVVTEASVTNNGGTTWSTPFNPATMLTDPTSSATNPTPFAQATDAAVDFDRNGNFYVLVSEHKADNSAGVLLLNKFNVSGGTPIKVIGNKVLDSWTADQALKPMIAVDNNLATFTDGANVQTDPSAGNVYVAWATVDGNPNNFNNFNPNSIKAIASSDGGQTFSGAVTINSNGSFGSQHDTSPRLAISQGSSTVPGGQVTVVYDDFGSLATATPTPLDILWVDRLAGAVEKAFPSQTGPIADAGANNTPVTTPFNITVSPAQAAALGTLTKLTVTLDIAHPAMGELAISLVTPNNTVIPLVANNTASGANMGIGTGGALLGTTFDASSLRTIANGPAPYIGTFAPAGNLGALQGQPMQSGTWQIQITDSTTGNTGTLVSAFLTALGGFAPTAPVEATTTTVRGAQGNTYPTAAAASPLGIGPGPVLASDNTLGAFSQFQGRLYLAYVDRSTITTPPNPADNTDVFLRTSDNAGATWSAPVMVNNDVAATDGFSEGAAGTSGRAQFEPSVAVDQGTGTVVLTFYDGRYDAARARVATTIATSIDGGKTFGPEGFANNPLIATDEATGQPVTLGPIPDNESGGNTATGADRTTFAFGDRQGLAVLHGHVYPAWSSNLNGGNDGKQLLNIRVATAEIAGGPRVISGTMGPVGLAGDTLNNTTAADGTPIAKSFIITFDRPVDPGTFGLGQAQVFFHDTVAGDAPVPVTVTGVTPLNTNALGATQFRVDFTASSQVGTYSYAVGPGIQDRIRSVSTTITTNTLGQNTFNAAAPQVPQTIVDGPGVPNRVNSTIPVAGIPAGQVVTGVTVNLTLRYPFTGDLTLTLIAPDGTQVQLVNQQPAFAAGNGDPTSGFINTTFDDAAATLIDAAPGAPYTGSFKPEGQLNNLLGKNPNGTWTLRVDDNFPVFDSTGSLQNWSVTIKSGTVTTTTTTLTGNAMDQNANATTGEANSDVFAVPTPNGGTPFQAPYNQNTLPLIVPGPHVVSTSVPGGVSDPNAPGTPNTLMLNGTVSSMVVTFDRDMDPSTFTPGKVLRIEGPAGLISGPFTVTPVAGNARAFTIGFPVQQLSGTYTITLDSSIKSASGFALDTNLNAGVDVLRGTSATPPVPVTFNSTGPVAITPGKTISSQITLNNDFVIQGLTLTLDITYPFDPDLSAVLVAPDGTRIPLFTNVGTTGNNQNFTSTVFDDNAPTPITNGGPPFFGRFQPQQPLGVLNNSSSIRGPGGTGTGVYTLEISDGSASNTGTLNSWSLTMLKPTPASGLGEPVADRSQLSFRIFTMDPANPVSSNTWTSVGPASIGGTRSGRIGGLAVDPSDPSGNTVYAAGASGGIWKTSNFLTTSTIGPTWIPLTDFGPTFGINIGGIAVFGRNNDPNQSEIYVATGEGDTGSTGVGILRSMDGGATWTLLDSTDNTLPLASRDHAFVGSTSFKILVDPHPTPTGDAIIYAALSGNNGGIWRSTDSGMHWGIVNPATGKRVANFAGQATDLVFDPNSGPIDAVSNPTGNLQVLYAAFRGDGVYVTPNQGQVWNKLIGGTGDPFIQDGDVNPPVPITVNNLGINPNGANGRIVLAKPDLFPSSDANAALKNFIYEGWLYAAVVTPDDHLQGLYLTKDGGQNWTKLTLPTLPPVKGHPSGVPSNDTTLGNYDPLGNTQFAQGNYDVSLVSDPTNPEVVYLGGTADGNPSGLIRIDVSAMSDPYAFFLANDRSDGGTLQVNSTVAAALKQNPLPGVSGRDPRSNPMINMTRNPSNPLGASTFYVNNTASFANNGSGVKWIPFDSVLGGSTDQHRVIAIRDPLTGHARLIFGDDQGVFSGVDNGDGTLSSGIGSDLAPTGSRNGNLQITQFYYGASQPSTSAATQIAGALFYGSAQDDGAPHSTGDILSTGNLSWTGPGGDYGGVATDQTGAGTLFQYAWPCCGGNITDFFQVNGVGHTNGLVQASGGGAVPDPQWPFTGVVNFAVNPINGKQIVISSTAGRVFRTEDQGAHWLVLGDPPVFGSSQAMALAFGAPDPALTGGSLDNFIYIGTQAGHIFVTFTGGGANGNNWSDISAGLDGSPIMAIVTNPTRTSHEAFAVTQNGVYHITDSNPAANKTWVKITGNLFQITHNSFGDPSLQETQLRYLTSIQADWRYVLPDNPGTVGGSTHPMLYVGGEGGVYQSADLGQHWTLFPSTLPNSLVTLPTPPGTGGGLPDAHVTDLSLALGNIDPTTGRAVLKTGDPNVLLATTYGRGSFAIRLAPEVVPNTTTNPPNWINLDTVTPGNLGGLTGYTTTQLPYTTATTPVINGLSEQSAFGNTVNVAVFDVTGNPPNPIPIPLTGSTLTDTNGHFSLHVAPGYFTKSGLYTVGIQATDQSGTKGNIALFTFVIDIVTPPAPTPVVLDATTDSGTYNGDDYTNFNNSLPVTPANSNGNAPLYDVSNVEPGATVFLLRAAQVNGVVGAFSVVGSTVNAGTTGTVQIYDVNGTTFGNQIPDTPINAIIDTKPPQPNQYVYSAYQVDTLNVQGPNYAPGLPVIIDATAPAPPNKVALDPSTDSGTSNKDAYTKFDNSLPATLANPHGNAPLFDVSGIEPHATVELFRDYIDPATGKAHGTPVLVSTIVDVTPTGPNKTVQIYDVNGGTFGTKIPDSPVGNPVNTAPPSGFPYIYSAIQIDLAGNPSKPSPTFGNQGAIVLDGTDSDLHGNFDAATGQNVAGWLYMQKVLTAIQPNVTDNQKVLVALGAGQPFEGSAADSIASAFAKSPLPGLGWTIVYVVDSGGGTANKNSYLSGNVVNAVTKTGAPAGTISLAQTGLLYFPSANETGDDLTDADIAMLNTHGNDIKNYVNSGGGLYTQCETPSGSPSSQNPPGYGWLTSLFPSLGYFAVGPGGHFGNAITLTPAGMAIFPGLTSADLSTGPWHGYFTGSDPSLAVMFTVIDDDGVSLRNLGLASVGGSGTVAAGDQVIIDSTAPVASVITLDPSTDSGTFNNDQYTNFNNNPSPAKAPILDVTNVEPNGIVNLYRALVNPATGLPGAPVLVNTITQAPGGAIGTLMIPDINGGNGTIPDGTYQYTTQQTDLAGNIGAVSAPVTVVIDATPPTVIAPFRLDAASDSGTFNNDGITKDDNGLYPAPVFDAFGVELHATVQLFRAPVINGVPGAAVLVNTLTNVTPGAGGLVQIADINLPSKTQIADGTYLYTALQIDLAGNPAASASAGYTVQIDSDGPQANPPAPPLLDVISQTGPPPTSTFITQDNNGLPYPPPTFDAGSAANPVEVGATVTLFRALVNPATGLPGAPVQVHHIVNSAGGFGSNGTGLTIVDDNADDGGGVIPDGTYIYTIQLTDLAGVSGSISAGTKIIIKASKPPAPSPFRLDPASDTGVSNSDGITQITLFHHPIFDVGSILAGATVDLFRNGSPIPITVLSNTSGGNLTIPDNTSLNDGVYTYTAQQIDLAGNISPLGGPITIIYDTAQPRTPLAPVLDPASDTGTKGDNITNNTNPYIDVTVDVSGPGPFEGNSSLSLVRDGTVVAISPYAAGTANDVQTVQINGAPTGGTFTLVVPIGIAQTTGAIPFNASAATVQAALAALSNVGAGNVLVTGPAGGPYTVTFQGTLAATQEPVMSVGTNSLTGGTNPSVTVPSNMFKNLVQIQDSNVPLGIHVYKSFLTDLAGNVGSLSAPVTINFANNPPGTMVLDPGSDTGIKGDNITNVSSPTFDVSGVSPNGTLRLLRNGLTVATVPTGSVVPVPFTITDPGPLTSGVYTYTAQQVDALGNISPPGPPLVITIDQTVPVAPTSFQLDPNSDSGFKGDNLTNVTNPTFDASGIIPGGTVNLFRDGNVVATISSPLGGSIMITDPGPVANGKHNYTVQQVSKAGNISPNSAPVSVTIDTTIPVGPTIVLDPASDTGIKGDNITSIVNPTFDATNVVQGAALQLFRNGLSVRLLTSVNVPASGIVMIQDPGPLPDGTYTYTAQQTSPAGNVSPIGAALKITINTQPPPVPTTPVIALDPSTDSGIKGDNITNARRLTISGSADPGVNINLFDGAGNKIGSTSTNATTGAFSITLTSNLSDGVYTYTAQAVNARGVSSPVSAPPLKVSVVTVAGDFTGAGKTSEALFRRVPNYAMYWFVLNYSPLTIQPFGSPGLDIPMTVDLEGDGKSDLLVYRPSTSQWFAQESSTNYAGQLIATFGGPQDIPIPGYYTAPGVMSLAVFRPSTGQFFVNGQTAAPIVVAPKAGDLPVPGNYNNGATDQFAVFRPSTSQWFIQGMANPILFGGPGWDPVPGAYDATVTNHAVEPAVFNASTGQFVIHGPSGNRTIQFSPGDIAAPGDYDGIGITEPAVFRPSTGQWYVQGPNDTAPRAFSPVSFGASIDVPDLTAYRLRALPNKVSALAVSGSAAGGLDFGASAVGLTTGSSPAAVAPVPAKAVTPPPAASPVVAVARSRPNQHLESTAHGHSQRGHLVDKALASITARRKTFHW